MKADILSIAPNFGICVIPIFLVEIFTLNYLRRHQYQKRITPADFDTDIDELSDIEARLVKKDAFMIRQVVEHGGKYSRGLAAMRPELEIIVFVTWRE